MYKAIDMRLRPPYKTLKEGMLFTGYMSPGQIAFRENMELHASKAAIELSMELFLQEMDDWGIEKGGTSTGIPRTIHRRTAYSTNGWHTGIARN